MITSFVVAMTEHVGILGNKWTMAQVVHQGCEDGVCTNKTAKCMLFGLKCWKEMI